MPATQHPTPVAAPQSTQHVPMPDDAQRLEGTLLLKDGTSVHMRAIRPDDIHRLRALHARLSTDTIIFRFFRVLPSLSDAEARRLTHLDYENRMALIATTGAGADEQIIAVVRYERIGPETGEVAFVVEDRWQGHGIATGLLFHLATYARVRGFSSLIAITMANNRRMLDVLRRCGFPCTMHYTGGEIEARLDISAAPAPAFTIASAAATTMTTPDRVTEDQHPKAKY